MLESFARKYKIPTYKKRNLYQLTVVDRTSLSNYQGQVMKKTKNLQLCVNSTTIRSEEFNLVQIFFIFYLYLILTLIVAFQPCRSSS